MLISRCLDGQSYSKLCSRDQLFVEKEWRGNCLRNTNTRLPCYTSIIVLCVKYMRHARTIYLQMSLFEQCDGGSESQTWVPMKIVCIWPDIDANEWLSVHRIPCETASFALEITFSALDRKSLANVSEHWLLADSVRDIEKTNLLDRNGPGLSRLTGNEPNMYIFH